MKTILLILLFPVILFSQVTYENGKAIIPEQDWKNFKAKALTLYYDNLSKDSVIKSYELITVKQDSVMLLYESIIRNDSTIIQNYKKINSSEKPDGSFIEWQGLQVGFLSEYSFTAESLKFFDGLRYGGFVNARLKIDTFIGTVEYKLPFNKSDSVIEFKIGKIVF